MQQKIINIYNLYTGTSQSHNNTIYTEIQINNPILLLMKTSKPTTIFNAQGLPLNFSYMEAELFRLFSRFFFSFLFSSMAKLMGHKKRNNNNIKCIRIYRILYLKN